MHHPNDMPQPRRVDVVSADDVSLGEVAAIEEVAAVDDEEVAAVDECSAAILHETETSNFVTIELTSMNMQEEKHYQLDDVDTRECTRRFSPVDIDPWTWSNAALPIHYIFAGIVQNIVMGVMYGVMLGTMAMPGHMYVTSRTLVAAPLALKVVFGFLSDSLPLFGQHRSHYCSIGWFIVAISHFVLAMSFHEPELPFYCVGESGNYAPVSGICNQDADKESWKLTMLMAVSVLGLTIAESAADGLTLECAKSWQCQQVRGRIMTTSLLLRMIGGMCGSAFLAFCFNGRRHLGWFSWEMPLATINVSIGFLSMWVSFLWQVVSSADLPESVSVSCFDSCRGIARLRRLYVLYNDGGSRCQSVRDKIQRAYLNMCSPRLAMFIAFNFIVPISTWLTSPSHWMMTRYWAGVQQMQIQLTDILIFVLFSVSILFFQRYFLMWRWRWLVVLSTLVGCIGSFVIETIVAWGLLRNQYFYQTSELFLQIPRACNYLVCIVTLAEIVPPGLEASVYGIVTSAHSLAPLVARSLSNPLYAYLPVFVSKGEFPAGALSVSDYYVTDTENFRAMAIFSAVVSPVVMLTSTMFVCLIPTNQIEAGRALSGGNKGCTRPIFLVFSVIIMLSTIAACVFSIFAILPGSSCEIAVGGQGC